MLNKEQQDAVDLILKGSNVFVTGSAGVGKSFFVEYLTNSLNVLYQILAPTGIAALNVRGQTIHRFFNLKIETKTRDDYLRYNAKYSKINWSAIKMIIVDEVSMWNITLFNLCDEICRYHKNNNKPFGGIQMVFIGDFYQLCPIREKSSKPGDPLYIFETELWTRLNIHVCILKTIIRQKDSKFITVLNNVRTGNITNNDINYMNNLNNIQPDNHYIKLFSKNIDKNNENKKNLDKIKGIQQSFSSSDLGNILHLGGLLAESKIILKIGAPVMLLCNLDNNLCNGSLGIVENFTKDDKGLDAVVVKFNNGTTRTISAYTWTIKDKCSIYGTFKTLASRTQIPLVVSFAISIHKSQGLTIDHVEAYVDGIFENGQLYVMLSRAVSPEGLCIKNFHKRYVLVDKRVGEFYSRYL
jgi:ATP-dependent DNA helicase PIF1